MTLHISWFFWILHRFVLDFFLFFLYFSQWLSSSLCPECPQPGSSAPASPSRRRCWTSWTSSPSSPVPRSNRVTIDSECKPDLNMEGKYIFLSQKRLKTGRKGKWVYCGYNMITVWRHWLQFDVLQAESNRAGSYRKLHIAAETPEFIAPSFTLTQRCLSSKLV